MIRKDKTEILIVEDSPTQAEGLRYTLERGGYDVRVVQNGGEALEAMERRSPALVVTDILMPVMDGFQLCRKIKEDARFSKIPVILLTALSEPEDVLKGLECGADNFITKPYDKQYLLAQIRHVLINDELRKESKTQTGVEVFFKEHKYFITSERQQILDLLLSTYETAIMKNDELRKVQGKLESLNERLEKMVEERTSALMVEIEERRRAEQEVRRLNAELERRVAKRTAQLETTNRELESFSYSISHDLKAPLRSISAFSQMLIEDHFDKLDEEGRRTLTTIVDNTKKMAQLIDDILAFSRAGRKEIEAKEIDVEKLVKKMVEEFLPSVRGRTLTFEIKKLPAAIGDMAAIHQVFFNLISNAAKFTESKEAAVIEIGGNAEGDENVYYVKDNGVGFDMQHVDRLFGVFQRLHSPDVFEGTGIGLAIVKRFVNKLHGRVWAEGRVNEGAVFYFTLPRAGA